MFREYLEERPATRRLPLDLLLAHYLVWMRARRNWAWTTTSRNAQSLVGAFTALPMYTNSRLALNPCEWTHYKALLTAARRLGYREGPREPKAATAEQVALAIERTNDVRIKAALILCWYTAGRPSDVLQLKRDAIEWDRDDEGAVKIRFQAGKVIAHTGIWYIPTYIPADHAEILKGYLNASRAAFVFPLATAYQKTSMIASIKNALRAVDPALECKSLRRGTLQLLAKQDLSDEALCTYSRHKTSPAGIAQLHRYLGWTAVPPRAQREAQRAARALAPDAELLGGTTGDAARDGIVMADWCTILDGEPIFSTDRAPEISAHLSRARLKQAKRFKLHLKPEVREPLNRSNLDAMSKIPGASKSVAEHWARASIPLRDVGWYRTVPFDGNVREASLTIKEAEQLCAEGHAVEVEPHDPRVIGTVHVWLRTEWDRQRKRVITHTAALNDYYGRETVVNRGNATRASARKAVIETEGCITLDMAQFFDQFELDEAVSWAMVFRVGNRWFRKTRLPMGMRHSTDIATSAMWVLLDFPRNGVIVDVCTDGVRFAGPEESVVEAAWTFVRRCRKVRAKINEIKYDTATKDDVRALYKRKDADFMGEVSNYTEKTRRCRDKHVAKLSEIVSMNTKGTPTYAQSFAWIAMLHYMSSTLAIRRDKYFATRNHYSNLARRLAREPNLWNEPNPLPPPPEIFNWTREALANRDAKIPMPGRPDHVVIVDACADGWAAITCSRLPNDEVHVGMVQRRWGASLRGNAEHSTETEPEAICRALDHVGAGNKVVITDHNGFVWSHEHGYSRSPAYNQRITRLLDRHPTTTLIHSPGNSMLADAYSRFKIVGDLTPEHRAAALDIAYQYFGRNVGHVTWERGRGGPTGLNTHAL